MIHVWSYMSRSAENASNYHWLYQCCYLRTEVDDEDEDDEQDQMGGTNILLQWPGWSWFCVMGGVVHLDVIPQIQGSWKCLPCLLEIQAMPYGRPFCYRG